jgi:hypothetical protein
MTEDSTNNNPHDCRSDVVGYHARSQHELAQQLLVLRLTRSRSSVKSDDSSEKSAFPVLEKAASVLEKAASVSIAM